MATTQDSLPTTRRATGPRTPEGKARSSQNARKHGLSARDVIVDDDDEEEFSELRDAYQAELAPQGIIEQEIFDQLVVAAWRLRLVRRLEASEACGYTYLLKDDDHDAAFRRYGRYQTRAERSYFRCLKELRLLQSERARRRPSAPPPVLAVTREMTKRTPPSRPSPIPQPPSPSLISPPEAAWAPPEASAEAKSPPQ